LFLAVLSHFRRPHLRSPSRHTTFGRLRRHLRRISRRDRPSRYGSFETLSGTSATPLIGLRPLHSSALGHDWALGSTHPSQPPRKQYRTSFPKPPLWETPQSPRYSRPPGQPPPPPTAMLVSLSPHLVRSTSTTDESQAWPALRMCSPPTLTSPSHLLHLGTLIGQATTPHVREYIPFRDTTQCSLCQRFGHPAALCKAAPACAVCAQPHLTHQHPCNIPGCPKGRRCAHPPLCCSLFPCASSYTRPRTGLALLSSRSHAARISRDRVRRRP
jgi:hypothetical protein